MKRVHQHLRGREEEAREGTDSIVKGASERSSVQESKEGNCFKERMRGKTSIHIRKMGKGLKRQLSRHIKRQ